MIVVCTFCIGTYTNRSTYHTFILLCKLKPSVGEEGPLYRGLSYPEEEPGQTGHQAPWQLGMCTGGKGKGRGRILPPY